MIDINKEPRRPEIETMRGLIRDRGSYLYYLVKAAKEAGVPWESIARKGLTGYGCAKFQAHFSDIDSLDAFLARYLSKTTGEIFDSYVIERDEEHLVIRAGYCPLLEAWVLAGASDEEAAKLCDIAMDGDRAMVNSIPGIACGLRRSLAFGDCQCEFLVEKRREEEKPL